MITYHIDCIKVLFQFKSQIYIYINQCIKLLSSFRILILFTESSVHFVQKNFFDQQLTIDLMKYRFCILQFEWILIFFITMLNSGILRIFEFSEWIDFKQLSLPEKCSQIGHGTWFIFSIIKSKVALGSFTILFCL